MKTAAYWSLSLLALLFSFKVIAFQIQRSQMPVVSKVN